MVSIRTARIASIAAAWMLLLLAPDSPRAMAVTTLGTNLNVSAAVDQSCIVTPGNVTFGVYDSTSPTPVDRIAVLNLACNRAGSIRVRLGQGSNPAPGSTDTDPLRRMTNGTDYLDYNLYEDAGYTTVWSNRAPGRVFGGPYPRNVSVYARLPAGQLVTSGTYTDAVTVTYVF